MHKRLNVAMLSEFIAANHMTKREFCKQCNMSASTLSRILAGKNFSIIFLLRIADVMNVELRDLFVP